MAFEYVVQDRRSRFYGWTVREGDDLSSKVHYTMNRPGTDLLRVHYRLARVPSRRLFTLRHLRGATHEDRAQARECFHRIPAMFAGLEAKGAARRCLNREGRYWVYSVYLGRPLEDPLVQLELEMMIDLESGVRA